MGAQQPLMMVYKTPGVSIVRMTLLRNLAALAAQNLCNGKFSNLPDLFVNCIKMQGSLYML
jgi:hypothetical protein